MMEPYKEYLTGIAVIMLAIMAFDTVDKSITGNAVGESLAEEKVIIYFPMNTDFVNPDEGTVSFDFSFPESTFRVADDTADVLVFLESDVIDGLMLAYDTTEKKLKAGLPVISSGEIDIFDGISHQIAYTFTKEGKEQAIYLDGVTVAKGSYSGLAPQDKLAGYSVFRSYRSIQSAVRINRRYSSLQEDLN